MQDVNIYQKAIEQLLMEGYTILQVVDSVGNNLFFNVYRFQEGYFNTAQSIDFNTVEGINITEFLTKNASMFSNRTNFLMLFNKVMDDGVVLRCEFSKESIWYKWSPSGTNGKK